MDLRPLAVALLDEYAMRRSFPVLADFSTPFELGRWESPFPMSVVSVPWGVDGVYALKVELQPADYAGFKLRYFNGDWRGFRTLSVRIFNPALVAQELTCRINDLRHETDNRFTDRYNGRFMLARGWSRIEMPLEAVRKAPKDREMDMARVTGLGCFTAHAEVERVLIVGRVGLK
jgi:hypothetical protein